MRRLKHGPDLAKGPGSHCSPCSSHIDHGTSPTRSSPDAARCDTRDAPPMKIFRLRKVNVWHILLRVAIHQREPGTLNLNHDAVPFLERCSTSSSSRLPIAAWLIRHKRFRLSIPVPKTAPNTSLRTII
ncbi:MAG UNVERIFIED_CONTAM: hypothetical protein LVR18_46615 [Planctomycetaceae bacterium]